MPLQARNVIDFDDPRVAKIGHPAPPWLINWADLTTELFAFFVMMYALSAALSPAVQQAKAAAEKVAEEVNKKDEGKIDTQVTKEGLRISMTESGGASFFPSGSAQLTPKIQATLAELAPALKTAIEKGAGEIVVEGHTDNRPIQTSFYPSNWELSTARATNVVQYLIHQLGLPPPKVSAIGYGEFRPVAPNDTPEHMAQNRRVVLFVKATESGRSKEEKEAAAR